MAKKAKKTKKRTLSKEHRAKISAAATQRHAKRRSTAAAQRANFAKPGPQKPARKTRVLKNGRAPEGVHVLRRNGNGRDLIECNADEVLQALRDVRAARKIFCSA